MIILNAFLSTLLIGLTIPFLALPISMLVVLVHKPMRRDEDASYISQVLSVWWKISLALCVVYACVWIIVTLVNSAIFMAA